MMKSSAPMMRRFYGHWVLANAIAEALGLGLTALLVVIFTPDQDSWLSALRLALIMIAAGFIIEGGFVGVLQGLVLRRLWPSLQLWPWIKATALGAGIAWFLGSIPSTLVALNNSVSSAETGASDMEMGLALTIMLAATMGLLLGPVLAIPQWWILRREITQAWHWIPANAIAWSAGMILIFLAAGALPAQLSLAWIASFLVLTLFITGAIVGAIHGLLLLFKALQGKERII